MLAQALERIIEPVETIHRQVATKWLRRTDPLSQPVKVAHDAISGLVYGAIRIGSRVAGGVVEARVPDHQQTRLQAIAEGLWGENLELPSSELSLFAPDGLRLSPEVPLARVGKVSGHVVVLVHGLLETERTWSGGADEFGLIDVLVENPSFSPILVRYNSGLSIERNGADLSAALDWLHESWPVAVESVSLVGHSMGGLVAREACATGHTEGRRWLADASHLVTIGAPHGGAPLETAARLAAHGLRVASVTRPVAAFLEGRSRGIKDLHVGRKDDRRLPTWIRQHVIAGVITADPEHLLGAVVGDLMVTPASSTAVGDGEAGSVTVVGAAHHFNLTRDPCVIDEVVHRLEMGSPAPFDVVG